MVGPRKKRENAAEEEVKEAGLKSQTSNTGRSRSVFSVCPCASMRTCVSLCFCVCVWVPPSISLVERVDSNTAGPDPGSGPGD